MNFERWDHQSAGHVRGLGALEYFGLFSGIIGLIADGLSLGFLAFQSGQQSGDHSPSNWIAAVWLLLFMGILYTIVIGSFYSRRLGAMKHRQKAGPWTYRIRERIERGANFASWLIGVPLILSYFSVGTVVLFNTKKDTSAADLVFGVLLIGFMMGGIFCFAIGPLNQGAMHLYALFDPAYNETVDRDVDREF